MPQKVSIHTLGCKLNQYDSEAILSRLRDVGYDVTDAPEEADLCIVNTCAVTATAERKTRNLLRRLHRTAPSARLMAVGCLAQHNPQAVKAIDGVNLVLGNREKEQIQQFLTPQCTETISVGDISTAKNWSDDSDVTGLLGRARAYVKVQDGCDEKCTYCIVPQLRGPARSRPIEETVEYARRLVDRGFIEIVLTGVNLGGYGRDLNLENGFQNLLRSLEEIPGLQRIRMGSMEPWGLSKKLLRFIADSEKICPHLHLSVQSAADPVLRRMNRRYTASRLDELISYAFSLRADWGLGADIIVGFPGEDDEHFAQTHRFLQKQPFTYLHLFPFSPRPGTPANRLSNRVPAPVIRKRMDELRKLDEEKRQRFRRQHIGLVKSVIPENRKNGKLMGGYTANYLRVFFEAENTPSLSLYPVLIKTRHPDGVQGTLIT